MNSSLLAPRYEVTLGSKRWSSQVVGVTIALEAGPLVDLARVTFPAEAPVDAASGDPVVIAIDAGAGDGAVAVLTGKVRATRRGVRLLTIECGDAGAELAAYRPATTFEQASAASIVEALCVDVGVEYGTIDTGPTLTAYVADPSRTAMDHVARLAAWSGALASVDADGRLTTRVVDGSQPEVALRFGREVVGVTQRRVVAPVSSFVVAGEAGADSASPPDAARPTSDFFEGERPEGPGPGSRWSFQPVFRTRGDAAIAGAAQLRAATSGSHRTVLEAWLVPTLRPGMVVRIDDLPAGLAGGPHWVERVVHRFDPAGGATTTAQLAEGGPAFDPMALLGALAGALGSLL